ncbi:MAG: glycosyl hydrolase [Bacteroidota bacterium]
MQYAFGGLLLSLSLLFSCQTEVHQTSYLEQSFKNPPNESRPRTWLHAMSGNMSKAGLTKDLEAMAEVGLGGFLLFNITQGIPNGPIKYNSPEHHSMIVHAVQEAKRLGLEFGIHNCDGWSSSGGPWITPKESMKMVVWSETQVSGGSIEAILEKPTEREGFYRDIAVIAYPALKSELDDAQNAPVLSASNKLLDLATISDGKIDAESKLNAGNKKKPWVQFSYMEPKTIRSAKVIIKDRHAQASLQTSDDGIHFTTVRDLFKVRTGKAEWAIDDNFEGTRAKYFRLQFSQSVTLKEVQLSSTYFVNNTLGRTSIARTENHDLEFIGNPESAMVIAKDSIRNLSNAMDESGVVKTILPQGNWTLLRFGYTSTGAFNNPASDEGRGLEVDKLNRASFKKHYDAFVKQVVLNVNDLVPNTFKYVEIDSYEMGGQNWTEGFPEIFQNDKGYDIVQKLPLIAGRFVQSPEASEAILYDYRQVISNLMAKNYYQYFTELCQQDGLKSYIEPYGFGPLNDLDVGGVADIPMGEFWMNRPITQTASAVSSAHIYGKPVISAESFTSTPQINWKGHPAMAKTSGDLAWTYGINEFVFHRFAHQANVHAEPGMTMNRWGFHFDRTQTWWKNAGAAWFNYIARGSYMLRQGTPVSDMLVYVGEGSPNSSYYRTGFNPKVPKEINFDNLNTDVLLNRLKIKGKELQLPEGTSYRFLVLKNSETLSMAVLRRLLEIAKKGIPIFGERPNYLSGYNPPRDSLRVFERLSNELAPMIGNMDNWDMVMETVGIAPDFEILNGDTVDYTHRKTDKADIYFFFNPDSVSKTFKASFRVKDKIPELWNAMDGSITKQAQFVNGDRTTITDITLHGEASVFVVFREASAKIESIKNPVNDLILTLSAQNEILATTSKNGSYHVSLASNRIWQFSTEDIPEAIDLSNDWMVSFKKEQGYEGTVEFDSLIDWSEHTKDSINYYSGTASYKKQFELTEKELVDDTTILLDLGVVYIIAEVKINGKTVSISWMPPFKADITDFVKEGTNTIELLVNNQWSNRLIGDERYPPNDGGYKLGPHRATDLTMPAWYTNNEPRPEGKRTTFTTASFYKKDDPLMPSGLLGPVTVNFSKTIRYKE